jgi:hypothetical protein
MHCRIDFKPRVHMVSYKDVLDVLMDSPLRSSVPQKENVGILPSHITLDITVAMV